MEIKDLKENITERIKEESKTPGRIENGVSVTVDPAIEDMRSTQSNNIGNLVSALSKAQGSIKPIGKDKTGYGYKYMTLGALIDAIKKPFADNGLAFVQTHYLKKGTTPSVVTETYIAHESNEWIKSSLEIPITIMKGLSPAQSVGVVATYGRRYALQAMVGVAADDDTDASSK